MKNKIYLEKRLKIIVPNSQSSTENNARMVASIAKNIESLGYIFDYDLFKALSFTSKENLININKEIVPILKQMKGAHRRYNPIYPNFPKQVMEMNEFELYANALVHYWSVFLKDVGAIDTSWLPMYKKEVRFPLYEVTSYDVIKLGTEEDFYSIFTKVVSANSSISDADKNLIKWFITTYKDEIVLYVPDEIPIKENLAFVFSLLLEHTQQAMKLAKCIKTPTDVLRIITALSNGDVSLAENTAYRNFSRPERRLFLYFLEHCKCDLKQEMLKYKNRWIRVGEKLHPFDYVNTYKVAADAFFALRNNEPITTFNSSVESCFLKNDVKALTSLLLKRPGEFARRLDHLLRKFPAHSNKIIYDFEEAAKDVSTPVLLQVLQHFYMRKNGDDFRPVFPKGNLAKIHVVTTPLKDIDQNIIERLSVIIAHVLLKRFSTMRPLGKVYIDKKLINYTVPFSQRSASKALRTITRGSKIDLDGKYDTIRFFVWWKNTGKYGEGRVDIDLSAGILDENFKIIAQISYYNLRYFGGCHSGDITDAPTGASEFIDMSMASVLKRGGRYIAMLVNSFNCVPLCNLPECFAGWMGRTDANSGEIYEPKTVKNKVDLASNTNISIPLLIDCKYRKVIWMDMALKNRPDFCNNLNNNQKSISLVCKAFTQLKKMSLFDLFYFHAAARGTIVDKKEEADVIFSETEGITPFDTDTIMADFLK